jgi:glucosamine--fructose-6-phosphate aminotransferase (isomerizing)
MKSLGNFPDPFIGEIAGQPAAIRRAAAGLGEQLPALGRLGDVGASRPRPTIIFTGMGSSYHACYPAVTDLATAGVAALHIDAAELLHFRMGVLAPPAVLVAVSQSGRSAELVRIARTVRGSAGSAGPPTLVTVTNGFGNPLAELADIALDTRAGDEAGPSTMTFAAALVTVAAVSGVLAREPAAGVAARVGAQSEIAADAAGALIARDGLAEELTGWLGERETVVLLARGPARAAAEMGALTLKEAVGLPAESLETAQFRHGPLELAGPGLAAFVIATEAETRDLDIGLATELVAAGSAVALVTAGGGEAVTGVTRIEVGSIPRALAPAVSVVPAQLLAWHLAVIRGRDPGSYLQASKVTTRE